MTPGWESDYGFQLGNYTPAPCFRKDPNGNFCGPAAEGVAGIRWRLAPAHLPSGGYTPALLPQESRPPRATCQTHAVPAPKTAFSRNERGIASSHARGLE
jgi:hypothetical protein